MKLIDTHSHMYLKQFEEDLELAVERAKLKNIDRIYLPNIDVETIAPMNQLASDYPGFFKPMMGLHPCSVGKNYIEVLDVLKKELDSKKYYAVGEIGIDLYWDKTLLKEQQEAFKIQIEWAKDSGLPIVIHARESFNEIFEIVDELNDEKLTGIFHCFTGTLEQAQKVIGYGGFKMGLGGVLTFKNSGLDKVVKEIELEHFVLETDAPYLSPVPYRGKRNESSYVFDVAQKLADIHELPIEKVADITTKNALDIYKDYE